MLIRNIIYRHRYRYIVKNTSLGPTSKTAEKIITIINKVKRKYLCRKTLFYSKDWTRGMRS